jgi:hypothetical protein
MSVLDQLLSQRPAYPYIGVEPEELIAALRALAEATEVREKRVMGFSRREEGRYLLVMTGAQLGGCMGGGEQVLLEKIGDEWKVVEVTGWCS